MCFCSSSQLSVADTLKTAITMEFFGVESENEVFFVSESIFIISVCRGTKTRLHRNSKSHSKKRLPEIILRKV